MWEADPDEMGIEVFLPYSNLFAGMQTPLQLCHGVPYRITGFGTEGGRTKSGNREREGE